MDTYLFGVDNLLFKDYKLSSLLQALSGLHAFNTTAAAGTCWQPEAHYVPKAV
jgi:hypothetical protein